MLLYLSEYLARSYSGFHVFQFRHGKIRVRTTDAGRTLPDINQSVFVPVYQWTQQNPTHECKDGGICTDAECQGQHGGQCEDGG